MKQEIPTYHEFKEHAFQKLRAIGDDPEDYTEWIFFKYEAWREAGWQKCVKGKYIPVINWKPTLTRCLPYRERNRARKIKVNEPKVISITEKLMRHGNSQN